MTKNTIMYLLMPTISQLAVWEDHSQRAYPKVKDGLSNEGELKTKRRGQWWKNSEVTMVIWYSNRHHLQDVGFLAWVPLLSPSLHLTSTLPLSLQSLSFSPCFIYSLTRLSSLPWVLPPLLPFSPSYVIPHGKKQSLISTPPQDLQHVSCCCRRRCCGHHVM